MNTLPSVQNQANAAALASGITMVDQESSPEALKATIAALQQEVATLKVAKVALDAQSELLENLLHMAATPELEQVLKVTLQHALEICDHITGAESSCLVQLTPNGAIKNKLLKHNDLSVQQQESLVSSLTDPDYLREIIAYPQAVLITDTRQSPYWQRHVGQMEVVRSALSIPIIKERTLLGILTLMHSQPNYFSLETAHLMQAIAKQIALAIEYARFYDQLETYSNALKLELEKGRAMQLNFLPEPLMALPGWEVAAFFQPARQVAGDFYDVFPMANGSIGLVIGDVCDKGVGAALFMGLFRSLLRIFSGHQNSLSLDELCGPLEGQISSSLPRILEDSDALKAVILTNDYIAQNHAELCMFATIFFGVLNPETGVLTYINGGHEAPIILRHSGVKERLKATGPCVGPMPHMNFKVQQVQLEPGDILLGYSDGVPDARSPLGAFFTEKRLLSLVDEVEPTPAGLLTHIRDQLQTHVAEADPFDDVTILVLQRTLDATCTILS